jgi:chorismate dehydratase
MFNASEFTGFALAFDEAETFYNKSALARHNFASVMSAILERSTKDPANLKKLRISIVQYLNTAPLVWGFTNGPLRGKYELSFTVPSLCAEALRTGTVDIAIIPAIEYQRILGLVILPDMAIASKNRVRSLLIVSKGPIERARSIALDASSRSTQALTRILCDRRWKIAPEFFEMPPDPAAMLQRASAALLIGDPALRVSLATEACARRGEAGEQVCTSSSMGSMGLAGAGISDDTTLHVYDVVEQWRKLTNLPAVLAVWAARRSLATPEVIEDFQSSLNFGRKHLQEISKHAAAELSLPANKLQRYLAENIDFTLDEENLRGLAHYFDLSAALGLIPQAKPVDLASAAPVPARQSA